MTRTYTLSPTCTLFHADCRDAMKALPDNSIDAIVTDPPYGLQFMGKEWDKLWRDKTYADVAWRDAHEGTLAARARKLPDFATMARGVQMQATHLEWAREAFRVLKPGGHIAAFSASRTYHRMACAIEDAGFEIRDSLMWIYGTGFPKSHDVSKGIDKTLGADREITREGIVKRDGYGDDWDTGSSETRIRKDIPATPATPAAAEWQGWGSALKPAFEPIVLARKPLSEGTVAANVLRWRTGAINVDACRVGTSKEVPASVSRKSQWFGANGESGTESGHAPNVGRWPANVVHDGSDEVVGAFPATASGSWNGKRNTSKTKDVFGAYESRDETPRVGDSGSAARFFYSAKASRADRAGSKHPTVKPISLMEWLCQLVTPPGGTVLDPFAGSGTTGAAATARGFNCILVEREAEYVADIQMRFAVDSKRAA